MDKVIIEYRDTEGADWVQSSENWSVDDLRFFNKVVGYEKYRVRKVEVQVS